MFNSFVTSCFSITWTDCQIIARSLDLFRAGIPDTWTARGFSEVDDNVFLLFI